MCTLQLGTLRIYVHNARVLAHYTMHIALDFAIPKENLPYGYALCLCIRRILLLSIQK